jgi:hypothetical protein
MTLFRVVLEVATPDEEYGPCEPDVRDVIGGRLDCGVPLDWSIQVKDVQVWDADYKPATVPHHVPDDEYAALMREEPKG